MEAERWSRCRFGSMRRSFCCGCFRLLLLLPVVAAGCCLFLLFVLRSLACTHNDRDEWIVFCCWHFRRTCRLAYVPQPYDPKRIQNRLSVFLSVRLSVRCLRHRFPCFVVSSPILSDLPTTLARSLTRDRMGTRFESQTGDDADTIEKNKSPNPKLSYCPTDTTSASEHSAERIHWSD